VHTHTEIRPHNFVQSPDLERQPLLAKVPCNCSCIHAELYLMYTTHNQVLVIISLLTVCTLTTAPKETWSVTSRYTARQLTRNFRSLSPVSILSHQPVIWSLYITFSHSVSDCLLRLSFLDWLLCDYSNTVCFFCVNMNTAVFYSLSTVCQYLTLYRLLFLCHCVHCCLLQSVRCLSVPHTPFADGRQTADYPAAVTPYAALDRQLWKTWLYDLWIFWQRNWVFCRWLTVHMRHYINSIV
jgi:hypothetical protein